MAEIVADDLRVCTLCIHNLANGGMDDGTDRAERAAERMAAKWNAEHLSPADAGEDEGRYSTRECDGCGDTCHGDRFGAVAFAR
jgi:hypothetical protein